MRTRRSLNQIELDCNSAIDRLLAGKPTEPSLIKLAERGRLKISFESVALEAPCSRTLLSLQECRLPQVRKRILELGADCARKQPSNAKQINLEAEISKLITERDMALQMQQEHFLAREAAERDACKWRDAYKRLKDQIHQTKSVVKPLRAV